MGEKGEKIGREGKRGRRGRGDKRYNKIDGKTVAGRSIEIQSKTYTRKYFQKR